MMVGICQVTVKLFAVNSLKEKRSIVKSIVEKSKKFNISIAEIDLHDNLDFSTIGFSVVSNRGHHIEKVMDKVIQYIDTRHDVEIIQIAREVF